MLHDKAKCMLQAPQAALQPGSLGCLLPPSHVCIIFNVSGQPHMSSAVGAAAG